MSVIAALGELPPGEWAQAFLEDPSLAVSVVDEYQTVLDRLWEAHDQLCGCDKPADGGRCSAPEETWGAFEYLGERGRGSNPAKERE